jgi:hypothetical protein
VLAESAAASGASLPLANCQTRGTCLVWVPREQKMLKGHPPRVICHQVYEYKKINQFWCSSCGERVVLVAGLRRVVKVLAVSCRLGANNGSAKCVEDMGGGLSDKKCS